MNIRSLCMLMAICHGLSSPAQSGNTAVKKLSLEQAPGWKDGQASGVVVKIVMATTDSISLGYIHPFRGNETTCLKGEVNATSWLNGAVAGKFGKGVQSSRLWVIRRLSITTDTSGATGFTHVQADFYARFKDGKCQPVGYVDTVLTYEIKNDASYSQALDQMLDVLYARSESRFPAVKSIVTLSEDALAQEVSLNTPPAIVTDKQYKKGIYRTYNDFLNNSPEETTCWIQPDTLGDNGTVKVYTMGADSVVSEVKDCWGLCLGGYELYKYENAVLVPIEYTGEGFVVARFRDPALRKNNAMAWRRAVSQAWPNDANPYERKRSVLLKEIVTPEHKVVRPVATRLELATGTLTF